MQKPKNLLPRKIIFSAITSLLVGLFLGLVYGYFVNPIEWVDVSMDIVRSDLQEDYLRMAIDSYWQNQEQSLAYHRWLELGDSREEILNKIIAAPGAHGREAVLYYAELVDRMDEAIPARLDCETFIGSNSNLSLKLWGGTTFFVFILAFFFYLRTRPSDSKPIKLSIPLGRSRDFSNKTSLGTLPYDSEIDDAPDPISIFYQKNPPIVNYIWSFVMGDDHFDETYSIDTKNGEFLGECGIEIAKTIENSIPKKAAAFDIWLFDKNEINTRSIILMSDQVYANDVLRTHFEMKGQPTLAEIGKEIEIVTDHLQMRIRVLDMICGQVEKGKCEYFQRMTLDVSIWQK